MGIMSMIARVTNTVEESTIVIEQAMGATSMSLFVGSEYINAHAVQQANESILTACNSAGDPSKPIFIAVCKAEIIAMGQVPTAGVLRDYISAHAHQCVQLTPENIEAIKAKYGKSGATSGLAVLEVVAPANAKKGK